MDKNKINENEFLKIFFKGFPRAGDEFEKITNWLLLGTGATISLLVSNLDKVTPYLNNNTLRWSMNILVMSILFGFISKYFGLITRFNSHLLKVVDDEIKPAMQKMNLKETPLDSQYIKIELFNAYPPILNWVVNRAFAKGQENPLLPFRRNLTWSLWQVLFVGFQMFFFLIFVIIISTNL